MAHQLAGVRRGGPAVTASHFLCHLATPTLRSQLPTRGHSGANSHLPCLCAGASAWAALLPLGVLSSPNSIGLGWIHQSFFMIRGVWFSC